VKSILTSHLSSHGFRHAALLLISGRIRALPRDGSPALVTELLMELARELVALAVDMRAPADVRQWAIGQYASALDGVLPIFSGRPDADFAHLIHAVQERGTEVLAHLGSELDADLAPRDLFMIYVPEDRLPVAAPIAVELAKRRFTIAFSDFEIESADAMARRHAAGMGIHRAGTLLVTSSFLRRGWQAPPESDSFRLVRPVSLDGAVEELANWLTARV
jgi:hypothetical protein